MNPGNRNFVFKEIRLFIKYNLLAVKMLNFMLKILTLIEIE